MIRNGNAEDPGPGAKDDKFSPVVSPNGWTTNATLTEMGYGALHYGDDSGPTPPDIWKPAPKDTGYFPKTTDRVPPTPGANFFAAAPLRGEHFRLPGGFGSAEQPIDVSGAACLIDTVGVNYTLGGYLGGAPGGGDGASVFVYFLDANGKRLGAASLTATTYNARKDPNRKGLYSEQMPGTVPTGTRKFLVRLGQATSQCEFYPGKSCTDPAGIPRSFLSLAWPIRRQPVPHPRHDPASASQRPVPGPHDVRPAIDLRNPGRQVDGWGDRSRRRRAGGRGGRRRCHAGDHRGGLAPIGANVGWRGDPSREGGPATRPHRPLRPRQ